MNFVAWILINISNSKVHKYVFVESIMAFLGLKCKCTCLLMVAPFICRHIIIFHHVPGNSYDLQATWIINVLGLFP